MSLLTRIKTNKQQEKESSNPMEGVYNEVARQVDKHMAEFKSEMVKEFRDMVKGMVSSDTIKTLKGQDGLHGKNGKDGRHGMNGLNGKDGKQGPPGPKGKDGSPDTGDQIIDKINAGSKKINSSRVDMSGQESAFSQLKGYLGGHGGDGGSSGSSFLIATGTVNGSNADFSFTSAPRIVVVDNVPKQKTNSDGTANWTGTTSITLTIAPTFDVFGLS